MCILYIHIYMNACIILKERGVQGLSQMTKEIIKKWPPIQVVDLEKIFRIQRSKVIFVRHVSRYGRFPFVKGSLRGPGGSLGIWGPPCFCGSQLVGLSLVDAGPWPTNQLPGGCNAILEVHLFSRSAHFTRPG